MRAVVDRVKTGAFFLKQFLQVRMDLFEFSFCEITAPNTGLVGDEDKLETRAPEKLQRPDSLREQLYIFYLTEIVFLFYYRAIPVDEDRRGATLVLFSRSPAPLTNSSSISSAKNLSASLWGRRLKSPFILTASFVVVMTL